MLGWEVAQGAPHLHVKSPIRPRISAPSSFLPPLLWPTSFPFASLRVRPASSPPFPSHLPASVRSSALASSAVSARAPGGTGRAVAGAGGAASGSGNPLGSWQHAPALPPSPALVTAWGLFDSNWAAPRLLSFAGKDGAPPPASPTGRDPKTWKFP